MKNAVATITPAQSATLYELRHYESRYPRVGRMNPDDAVAQMIPIVLMAYTYKGMSADTENIKFIANNLVAELLEDKTYGLRAITIEECRRAIKKAIFNDPSIFISVATLYKILLDYAKGEGHRIEEELRRRKNDDLIQASRNSAPGIMIQAYAGAMVKNNKV